MAARPKSVHRAMVVLFALVLLVPLASGVHITLSRSEHLPVIESWKDARYGSE